MNRLGFLVSILLCLMAFNSVAQDSAVQKRYKIAVFTPFFLDSAFDEYSNYRYGKNFPKFINPGLEFYEGSIMAADSLNNEGVPLEISFYDSRDDSSSVQNAISKGAFDSVDLVIGHVNGSEARSLAMFAAQKSIPFINTTYPNDAGISNNPFYVILNSTLYTHCNAMYKFIQKNHALKSIVLFRKKGAQEDRLEEYFNTITNNTNAVPLKIKVVTLEDSFAPDDVKQHLNPDASTICIAGSLDLPWGQLLAETLAALYTETPTILFGMPTWWDNTDFSKPEFKGLEVMYTTPFYYYQTNPLVVKIGSEFRTRFYSRPTDMVFRGYETLYHFGHLLQIHGNNISSALTDKKFRILTDLDIQPVLDPKTNTLDYFENKKIYLVRKVDGVVTAVY
jgi:ABC-type branched-subunit amino acid transport system substrate-binding protein